MIQNESSSERPARRLFQHDGKSSPLIFDSPKLVRYIHDRGLKLVVYWDMGTHTRITIDAQTFDDWKVDMLKFDGCYPNATEQEQEQGERLMKKRGEMDGERLIGYCCCWPANYNQLEEIYNLWCNYGNVKDSWQDVPTVIHWLLTCGKEKSLVDETDMTAW
uniref:Uncharacterized protein n=1 Tax=Oncorhynchus kisutch TaxID=8019 RepID=A0A8C7FJ85_ONCKI